MTSPFLDHVAGPSFSRRGDSGRHVAELSGYGSMLSMAHGRIAFR